MTSECIPDADLRSLLIGHLSDEVSLPLEEHLLQCQSCVERATRLESSDSLVAALRSGVQWTAAAKSSAEVEAAIDRLRHQAPVARTSESIMERFVNGSQGGPDHDQLSVKPGDVESAGGRLIGNYEILEEIARGGMGVVYKARHQQLNRFAAVKLIKAGECADDVHIRRFRVEAQAAAQLDHPHIVQVYEIGLHGRQQFLATALVDGQSLWEHVKSAPLESKAAARIVQQTAEAVEFAHRKGIIHRDLKPQNVLIGSDGNARVTDFGLAKLKEQESSLTNAGEAIGTPNYMPPEQAAGMHNEVGIFSDVYSLGATLYCCLTCRPPFQGVSPVETLMQVIHDDVIPPRRLNKQVPLDLETICLKCLEKDPSQRYVSAAAVAEDLKRFLCDQPIVARPVSRLEQSWRWCRRNRKEALLLAFVSMLMIGITAVSIFAYVRESHLVREKDQLLNHKQLLTDRAQRERERARRSAADARIEAERARRAEAKALEHQQTLQNTVAELRREKEARDAAESKAEMAEEQAQLTAAEAASSKSLLYGRRAAYVERIRETARLLNKPVPKQPVSSLPSAATVANAFLERTPEGERSWEWNHLFHRCKGGMSHVDVTIDGDHPFLTEDGAHVAFVKDAIVNVLNVETGSRQQVPIQDLEGITELQLSLDAQTLLAATTRESAAEFVVWHLGTNSLIHRQKGQRAHLVSNGSEIWIGPQRYSIEHSHRRLKPIGTAPRHAAPDANFDVRLTSRNGLWVMSQNRAIFSGESFSQSPNPQGVIVAAFARDESCNVSVPAVGGLWFVPLGKPGKRHSFDGYPIDTRCAAFSPDIRRVATVEQSGVVTFWATDNGTRIFTLPPAAADPSAIAFLDDGRRLTVLHKGGLIRCWLAQPSETSLAD